MLISGVQKFTMLDFPGRISCIVFIPGCNFRCGYCHNPEFVLPDQIQKIKRSFVSDDAFFGFLRKRQGLLDGVVISGGEPTLSPHLPEFIAKIRAEGFLVKLDTNGNNPKMLVQLLRDRALDYIAMDVKTDVEHYPQMVGSGVRTDAIVRSIQLIMRSGVDYEFRCTVIRELHTKPVLLNMAVMMQGARAFYLQKFRPGHTLQSEFSRYHPFSQQEMEQIAGSIFSPRIQRVEIR